MDRVRLELGFIDEASKKFRLSVDDPKDNLDKEDLEAAMNNLIEYNVFESNGKDLVEAERARIITTSIQEIEF